MTTATCPTWCELPPGHRRRNVVGTIRIPRFGPGYDWVIVEGAGDEDLKHGPGHVPGTALPGEAGYFVVLGHRTTYGAPFGEIQSLKPGDPIVVEKATLRFTYKAIGQFSFPLAASSTEPLDGAYRALVSLSDADARFMIMATCHPRGSSHTSADWDVHTVKVFPVDGP